MIEIFKMSFIVLRVLFTIFATLGFPYTVYFLDEMIESKKGTRHKIKCFIYAFLCLLLASFGIGQLILLIRYI